MPVQTASAATSTAHGVVRAWGYNQDYGLGDGSHAHRSVPTRVVRVADATALAAGDDAGFALRENGTVWAWGHNWDGQLGDGTTTTRPTAVQVSGLDEVTAIAADGYSAYALREDGTVWAWGDNYSGQLGDGTTISRSVPVEVRGLSDVARIATSGSTTYALREDGTVWAWGDNTSGQLGDGTTTARTVPVRIAGLADVVDVAGAQYSGYALRADGSVWSWGRNLYGQIGPAVPTGYDNVTPPVRVTGLDDVVSLGTGATTAYAVLEDGTAWAWGHATALGTGATSDTPVPARIAGLTDVVAVDGGGSFASAVLADGTVWSWGDNFYGQLGDGNQWGLSELPVQVVGLRGVTEVEVAARSQYALGGTMDNTPEVAVPLLAAHGITGKPEDMQDNLDLALERVPSLSAVKSADTAPVDSVWENAWTIVSDAAELTSDSGQSRVNVIAHSKGGLDARVAMWQSPSLFRGLGMLATPNGGSTAADTLCRLRRAGVDWLFAEQGACDGPENGLYDLQTGYMSDVFNPTVRDWPQHVKYVTAGDCTAGGDLGCEAKAATISECPILFIEGATEGNDGVVCVSSAFRRSWMVTDGITSGTDFPLLPVFALDHTGMKDDPCPTSQLLAELYGQRNQNNPYVDGGACESQERNPSRSGSGLDDAAALAEPLYDAAESPRVLQRVDQLQLQAGVPTDLPVSREGADSAQVVLYSQNRLDVAAKTADDSPDPSATITSGEEGGAVVTVVTVRGSSSGPGVVTLTSEAPSAVAVVSYVEPGTVNLDAAVVASAPNIGTLTATVTGLAADQLAQSTVTAVVDTPSGATDVTLAPAGTQGTFQAAVPLQPGGWTPADVTLAGPVTRTVTVGAVTADASATILGATGDRLVDVSGDGVPETLEVDVAVRVPASGWYGLVADFVTGDGDVAFSAPGWADLSAGDGVVTLQAPTDAAIAAGWDGPFALTGGILTDDDDGSWVATRDDLGVVGAYPVDELPVGQLGLYSPTLGLAQDDPDALVAGARAAILRTSTYHLSGSLVGPDGDVVQQQSVTVNLDAGVTRLDLPFDRFGLPNGEYRVTDLTLADAENADERASAAPATFELSGSQPEVAAPALRSRGSLDLGDEFATGGVDGDVVTGGDFECSASVHVSGDVVAVGDVRLTEGCRVDGGVYAGGSATLSALAVVEGDLHAVDDLSVVDTARVRGSVTVGGAVRSPDGWSVDELLTRGVLGDDVKVGASVGAPTLPDAAVVAEPADHWPGADVATWPGWTAEVGAGPGCLVAPTTDLVVEEPRLVDARTGDCAAGVTLQGATLRLGADLVLYANQLSLTDDVTVESLDGERHVLRLLAPGANDVCADHPAITVADGLSVDPQIDVEVVTGGLTRLDGPASLTGHVDTGCFTSTGSVELATRTTVPAGIRG
jgi:alpha-tubulin suppressor-like RCC1 family protein